MDNNSDHDCDCESPVTEEITATQESASSVGNQDMQDINPTSPESATSTVLQEEEEEEEEASDNNITDVTGNEGGDEMNCQKSEIPASNGSAKKSSTNINLRLLGMQLPPNTLITSPPDNINIFSAQFFRWYNLSLASEQTTVKKITTELFKNILKAEMYEKQCFLKSITVYIEKFECVCNFNTKDQGILKLHYYDVIHLFNLLETKENEKELDKSCVWPIMLKPDSEKTFINQRSIFHSPIKYMWSDRGSLVIWYSNIPKNHVGFKSIRMITFNKYDLEILKSEKVKEQIVEDFFKDAIQAIPYHYLVCLAICVYIFTHYPHYDPVTKKMIGKFKTMRQMEKFLETDLTTNFGEFSNKIFNICNYLYITSAFPKLNEKIDIQRKHFQQAPYKQTLPFVIFFLRKEIWKMYNEGKMYKQCPIKNCWRPRCHGTIFHIPDYGNVAKSIWDCGCC